MAVVGYIALYLLQIVIAFIIVVSDAISLFKDGGSGDKIISIIFFPAVSVLFTPFIGFLICIIKYEDKMVNKINPKLVDKIIPIYVVACCAVIFWGFLLGIILGS